MSEHLLKRWYMYFWILVVIVIYSIIVLAVNFTPTDSGWWGIYTGQNREIYIHIS